MKRIIILLLFCFSLSCAFGFQFKNPFKKKPPEEKPKMVETVQEWEEQSVNIPLEERKIENTYKPPESTKEYIYPNPGYYFEKYNYPQGYREVNIEDIRKNTYSYPFLVSDVNFNYVAYARYYYAPDIDQISSEFYVEKLDTTISRVDRILNYTHNAKERKPVVQSGMKKGYPKLFGGLSLVDWSMDSRKVLIKEKVGSTIKGIYKTYLYVYILPDEVNSGYTLKLSGFDSAIRQYFREYQNKLIIKYRYDIVPLGFSAEDDDVIVAHCFVLDKEGKKLFMGTWGYNIRTNETMLYSTVDPVFPLSTNGMLLRESYN